MGYHICQADNNVTCLVAEFVHSLAAQMTRSPQLKAYKEMLLQEPHLHNMLSLRQCLQDPSKALIKGVLDPLMELRRLGKIPSDSCLILIDSLNEAEFHKPDYGDTIASFLTKHIMKFPAFLKLIVTVRTVLQDITKFLPFHRIIIDKPNFELSQKDVTKYLSHRINTSGNVRVNLGIIAGEVEDKTSQQEDKFIQHVQALSRGCFLYCKLLLDLIEQGHLVLKSTNYKILPVNLSEVFLLLFNLKFPSVRSFDKLSPILNACLASLYPLHCTEIYEAVNASYAHRYVTWEDYLQRLELVKDFLIKREDSSYMFFHPAFREWLLRREEHESSKFLCDLRFVFWLFPLHNPETQVSYRLIILYLSKPLWVNYRKYVTISCMYSSFKLFVFQTRPFDASIQAIQSERPTTIRENH